MTAVCISSTRGVNDRLASNFTIATSAPTSTFDFELRYNLLDQNSVAITKKDLKRFLDRLLNELCEGTGGGRLATQFFQTAVNGTNFVGPQI
jgi:hypothetical protein